VDDGVETADFSGYADWSGYDGMSFRARTDIAEARYEGACSDAAAAFGFTKMDDYVDSYTWGYGWGPMTDAWMTGMLDVGVDLDGTGDTIGTTYLEWEAGGVLALNLWGYFKVYGFDEGTHIDIESGPLVGVSDSAAPFDGYYETTTVYVLSFAK
jgi:hypothetical protein